MSNSNLPTDYENNKYIFLVIFNIRVTFLENRYWIGQDNMTVVLKILFCF